MDVQTPRPGLLTLSEIYYPEWKAKVDGAQSPVLRADYALRAIPVARGHHTVACYYAADALKKGLRISCMAFALTVLMGATGFFLNGKTRKSHPPTA